MFYDFHTHHHYCVHDDCAGIVSRPLSESEIPKKPSNYYSLECHPWHLSGEWETYEKAAVFFDAIGETGLDKLCSTDYFKQLEYFEHMLDIAARLQKPVIIHEVRATSEVIAVLKKYPIPRILVHHFGHNQNKMKSYLDIGAFLSVSCLKDPLIPLGSLGLESDDKEVNIRELYRNAAGVYHLEAEVFEKQMEDNFKRFLML